MKMNTMVQATLLLASHPGSRDTEAYTPQLSQTPHSRHPTLSGEQGLHQVELHKAAKAGSFGMPPPMPV